MSKTLISCTLSEEANEIYQGWKFGSKSALISELIVNCDLYPIQVKTLKTRVGHLLGLLGQTRDTLASQMRLNPHLRVHERDRYETIIDLIQVETEGTIYHDPSLSTLELQTS